MVAVPRDTTRADAAVPDTPSDAPSDEIPPIIARVLGAISSIMARMPESIDLYCDSSTESEILSRIAENDYSIEDLLGPCDQIGLDNAWSLAVKNKHWEVLTHIMNMMEASDYEKSTANGSACLSFVSDMPLELASRAMESASEDAWTVRNLENCPAFLVMAHTASDTQLREEILRCVPEGVHRHPQWDSSEIFKRETLHRAIEEYHNENPDEAMIIFHVYEPMEPPPAVHE